MYLFFIEILHRLSVTLISVQYTDIKLCRTIGYRIGNNRIAAAGRNIDKLRPFRIFKITDKQGRKDSEGFHIQMQHPTDFLQILIPNAAIISKSRIVNPCP